ncbi:MAG TPA: hypothetical protein VGY48_30045 [Vicinamibacterales bacterium]|nr:hypothetical protein [Vicinamibacterales bacterium]
MPPLIGRLVAGVAVAVVAAWLMAVPRVAGVETWKWVLGVIGLALFLVGGVQGRQDRPL